MKRNIHSSPSPSNGKYAHTMAALHHMGKGAVDAYNVLSETFTIAAPAVGIFSSLVMLVGAVAGSMAMAAIGILGMVSLCAAGVGLVAVGAVGAIVNKVTRRYENTLSSKSVDQWRKTGKALATASFTLAAGSVSGYALYQYVTNPPVTETQTQANYKTTNPAADTDFRLKAVFVAPQARSASASGSKTYSLTENRTPQPL